MGSLIQRPQARYCHPRLPPPADLRPRDPAAEALCRGSGLQRGRYRRLPERQGRARAHQVAGDEEQALPAVHQDAGAVSADELLKAAATGDLTDVHDYTIASTRAAVATEMTVAFRNRAVEAFTEIMRMHI